MLFVGKTKQSKYRNTAQAVLLLSIMVLGLPVIALAAGDISGNISEDVNADANMADAVAFNNVTVELFLDDGDNTPDAGDVSQGTTTTNASGNYTFSSVADGTYWVVVDSKTLDAPAGYNSGNLTNIWGEQTYGSAGAQCDNYTDGSITELGTAGACYGGQNAEVSDNAAAITTAEHITKITVAGANVNGVDFGFSFVAITNSRDVDDDGSNPRWGQGSLRQFILNGNAIVTNLVSNFEIPLNPSDPGYNAASGGYISIQPTAELDTITDPITLDGYTQTGASASTTRFPSGFNTVLKIELNGSAIAGSGSDALIITAGNSTVRGLAINTFTGSGANGIYLQTNGNNVISGNFIGTDVGGTLNQGIATYGIRIDGGSNNVIGGSTAGEGNIISNNSSAALIMQVSTSATIVQGNFIGTDISGSLNLGNQIGINISSTSDHLIGGTAPGEGNIIAYSVFRGIFMLFGDDNAIIGNHIFANGDIGIDLISPSGVTENDAGDGDSGSNGLLNFPVITSATESGGTISVDFDLDVAAGDYRVEFFTNPSGADASGNGEGEVFAGFMNVTHTGSGSESFSTSFAGSGGAIIAATTTECTSGACTDWDATSEFSDVFNVPENDAVSSVVSEISPNTVAISSTANAFVYDLLPTISGSDTGVNQIAITAPAGFTNFAVTGVSVGGSGQTLGGACPTVGAGEYCASVAGQVMTVTLGTKITTSLTNINIAFTADAPASSGTAAFTSTVDDTSTTTAAAQASAEGNADGDATDGDSYSVTADMAAAASCVAEVDPATLVRSSTGASFRLAVSCATTGSGGAYSGVNRVTMTMPTGFSNFNVGFAPSAPVAEEDGVFILLAPNCPAVSLGDVCIQTAGQEVTFDFGRDWGETARGKTFFDFYTQVSSIDAPTTAGAYVFGFSADDTATTVPAQTTNAGDAIGLFDTDTLTVTVIDPPITSAVAELSPTTVLKGASNQTVTFDIVPTITGSDTGVDELVITWPGFSYSYNNVLSVNIGGVNYSANCSSPGANEFCASNTVTSATLALGTKITTDLTPIQVVLDLDAPDSIRSDTFTVSLNDTAGGSVNASAGNADGDAGDDNSLQMQTVNRAVTSVVGEISPNVVGINMTGEAFSYDILPTITAGDTGVDQIAVTAPAGFANLAVTGVSVGGAGQTLGGSCPTVGAGEYCASVVGQVMTITLGSKVTTDATAIDIAFSADTPNSAGVGVFTSTVDDSATTTAIAQNVSVGNADGDAGDQNSQTVTVQGAAVTSLLGEISPNTVAASSTANAFAYDLLPSINVDDTGIDQLAITAPAGFANLAVTGVSVGGSGQTPGGACPAVGAGEYCASVVGQVMTVTLGTKVTTNLTNINIAFTADAPTTGSSADFTVTVDDTATALVTAQSAVVGDADGDAGDQNSQTVLVEGLAASNVLSEISPNAVLLSSSANTFSYDVLPTIASGDTGIDQLAITAPAGFANLAVTGVSVGGSGQTPSGACPTVGAGEYCATIVGQVMTVTLGTKVTTNLTNINIAFTADAPGTAGSGDFISSIDDTQTGLIAAQATAAGNADSDAADQNSQTVVVQAPAVSSVVGEISPNTIAVATTANAFSYHVLASIGAGDSGFEQIQLTAPAGYSNLAVTGVSVGGSGQTLSGSCPTVGAGEYCASVVGQVMIVTLGSKVTLDATAVQIDFTADAPITAGSAAFTSTIDDLSTAVVPAQTVSVGDADGDATDQNSQTVVVQGNAVSALVAEITPNSVVLDTVAQVFTYDLLPSIVAGDTGFNQMTLNLPAGYTAPAVNELRVGGAVLTSACPAIAANDYCATIAGQSITVDLATAISSDATAVQIRFAATTPAVVGTADVMLSVDDTNTATVAAQTAVAGNADSDAGDNNSITVAVIDTLFVDPAQSSVTVSPDLVLADGVALSTVTVTLRTSDNRPVPNKAIQLSSSRGVMDIVEQPLAVTDINGVATGSIRSSHAGISTITAVDTTDSIELNDHPSVRFTQPQVLRLTKSANKREAVVGDVVTYRIAISNTRAQDVTLVQLIDRLPANFKYVNGSARLDGEVIADPSGQRERIFTIGTVAGLVDTNGNGQADPGEDGYRELIYQLIVGAGAMPGEYDNSVSAIDVCASCQISNISTAAVSVVLDPLLDLGTLIGKVFNDLDGDGYQDTGEAGIAGVMVALDDGTYVITDQYGRYHVPAIEPGHRLVKINLSTVPGGHASSTTSTAQVVAVTPGLLVKANFGIQYQSETATIGQEAEYGVRIETTTSQSPVVIQGNAETLSFLINDHVAHAPTNGVAINDDDADDVLHIKGHRPDRAVEFDLDVAAADQVQQWRLEVFAQQQDSTPIHVLTGSGAPAKKLTWNGQTRTGDWIQGGQRYVYQLHLQYNNGDRFSSARKTFAVSSSRAIEMNLGGGAFAVGSAQLTSKAIGVLSRAARMLRKYPNEKIVIAGYTDSVGSADTNQALSKQRAQAARDFLVEQHGLPEEQFVLQGYGETNPLADNGSDLGRDLNRRVNIQSTMNAVAMANVYQQYQQTASTQINGQAVNVDANGRFQTVIDESTTDAPINLQMTNRHGRSVQAEIVIPSLVLSQPADAITVAYGEQAQAYEVIGRDGETAIAAAQTLAFYTLQGQTNPGNRASIDGLAIEVDANGHFEQRLALKAGANIFGVIARNAGGYMRVANLRIDVNQDLSGDRSGLLMTSEPVPNLSVQLPPQGIALRKANLVVPGWTDAENQVLVNGQPVSVNSDGSFVANLELPMGDSELLIDVIDPQGYRGQIQRRLTRSGNDLFFLAFADAKVSQLKTTGNLEGAGVDAAETVVKEGRVAYYLKGTIAGKYLITSAFDSGRTELNQVFKDLDATDNDRLLTNLDPDKQYPVYGDNSEIVYDTESQGKLYLALQSDQLNVLLGNYPLSFTDTELAAYQRTLYGARLDWRSAGTAANGLPNTEIHSFAASVQQAPVRNRLRATGGSLYYLSQRQLIEGSEQIRIQVLDKDTGLLISEQAQQRNIDYRIDYDEGRVLFNRPIRSSDNGNGSLIENTLQGGHPVYIFVDYEARLDAFEQQSQGLRARQQLGDRLSVGVTHIEDDQLSSQYRLEAVDVRWEDRRYAISAELADSVGNDAQIFVSEDGGYSYNQHSAAADQKGQAYKVAVDVNTGLAAKDAAGQDGIKIGAYVKHLDTGFVSNGTLLAQGSDQHGVQFDYPLTKRQRLSATHDREQQIDSTAEQQLNRVDWLYKDRRWQLRGEYQQRRVTDASDITVDTQSIAAEVRRFWSERLNTGLAVQSTLEGVDNDQLRADLAYQLSSKLQFNAAVTDGTQGQAAELGISTQIGGSRLYLTQQQVFSGDKSANTVFGSDTQIDENTRVYSEYQLQDQKDQQRHGTVVGAERRWDINQQRLQLLIAAELSDAHGAASADDYQSLAFGLNFRVGGLKVSTRNEVRQQRGSSDIDQLVSVNSLELRLNPAFTGLADYEFSRTEDTQVTGSELESNRISLGLAYRPINNDRLNALLRLTTLTDQPTNVQDIYNSRREAEVLSVEWSYQLTSRLEWVGKQAFKRQRETTAGLPTVTTDTSLSIQRFNRRLLQRYWLGVEYRVLQQKQTHTQREGALVELMWEPVKALRIGGGYNFTDFSDNEFSDNDYSVEGWFFRLQGKY